MFLHFANTLLQNALYRRHTASSLNHTCHSMQGLCDNLLTCIVRAWEVDVKPIVVAPAMNTLMWKNELTNEHLLKIRSVYQMAYIEPVSNLFCIDMKGGGGISQPTKR